MVNDVELRWKMGRANKGSPGIPQKLQYLVQCKVLMDDDGLRWEELQWSEWRDVKRQYAADRS